MQNSAFKAASPYKRSNKLKKFITAFALAAFLVSLCTSCATESKSKKAEEPVIENVNVKGIWVNLTSDDKEFINAIAGGNNFEDIGLWFKPKGIAQIIFKANGTYYTSNIEDSMLKYKVSGAGLSLKFPDGSIIKGIVKINGSQFTYTIPDTPPLVLTMTKYTGEEPKILK